MTKKKTEAKAVVAKVLASKAITAIVMQEVQLSPRQTSVIQQETPAALIKSKSGRGGKRVSYVEGGYVISKLNEAFSPLGWEFKIVEKGTTERKNEKSAEGEVWVYGELTIIDHKNGYRATKGQYGQHPIHEKVPIGDAYKAAGTDALKKCASFLGIALDVYWGTLDKNEDAPAPKMTPAEMFERAKMMIASTKDTGGLVVYAEKLKDGKLFNAVQKAELNKLISQRVDMLDAPDQSRK
ncbi:hypothetical protein COY93_03600 [Candidatus Uhrbacteria bacterium CG_4_10_14_0_8_um_filter_58_22]|uniref:Uncharacterized protein n=1 Tax=Candidatus Uhrbacteria bacterium CG_4_10_14_0_8_um_filter_58_22 TaxID=1975029 RepID=A0A2M7Q9C1_9BACT|nr:MAG: hypothetical protein AUJ19_00745 [Parcubacteria group bacterium CG1_02_58_44]PIY62194.1 MAG: hypothetical protein COY93_03600 [Candidatus Uhrbacteria bacterium CG_4_10_14_0_8_um_filter_58_22]